MAVKPEITKVGYAVLYEWVLTSADPVAEPTKLLCERPEKTVDVHGASDAAGFNTARIGIHGTLALFGGTYKLLNSVPDTQDLSFTAATSKPLTVLPNVSRIKPVVESGTLGATGVRVQLLVFFHYPSPERYE